MTSPWKYKKFPLITKHQDVPKSQNYFSTVLWSSWPSSHAEAVSTLDLCSVMVEKLVKVLEYKLFYLWMSQSPRKMRSLGQSTWFWDWEPDGLAPSPGLFYFFQQEWKIMLSLILVYSVFNYISVLCVGACSFNSTWNLSRQSGNSKILGGSFLNFTVSSVETTLPVWRGTGCRLLAGVPLLPPSSPPFIGSIDIWQNTGCVDPSYPDPRLFLSESFIDWAEWKTHKVHVWEKWNQ